jgi:hypothetical protein
MVKRGSVGGIRAVWRFYRQFSRNFNGLRHKSRFAEGSELSHGKRGTFVGGIS